MELYINDEFFIKNKKSGNKNTSFNLKIIYEDKNIILADKKAGELAHGNGNPESDTVISQIISYLILKNEYSPDKENSFTPALCNRLDRNTSGIIIAAKNALALRTMNEIIRRKMVRKIYLALCNGNFKQKNAVLTGYLVKNKKLNKVQIYDSPQNKSTEIITAYNVIRQEKNNSLLEVELITGKTHQIRAHLASIGHPIVGDPKYGEGKKGRHQALHAYKLIFLGGLEDTVLSYLAGRTFSSEYPDFLHQFQL